IRLGWARGQDLAFGRHKTPMVGRMRMLEPPPAVDRRARSVSARVAHVVPEYLPRSATFIHTLLRHQTRFRPLVLAQETSNLDEFPIERALALDDHAPPLTRKLRTVRGRVSGFGSEYERRIAREA